MSDIPIRPILEFYGWELPPERYGWRTVKCFAHNDSHASARITEEDGGWVTCMACGLNGDAVDIVKHYEPGMETRDAFARAEELAGISSGSLRGGAGGGRGGAGVSGGSRFQSRKRRYVPPRRGAR